MVRARLQAHGRRVSFDHCPPLQQPARTTTPADGGRVMADVKVGYGQNAAEDWAGSWERCVDPCMDVCGM